MFNQKQQNVVSKLIQCLDNATILTIYFRWLYINMLKPKVKIDLAFFLTLDLKAKSITFESTFGRSCWMVFCKLLQSKIKIYSVFLLTLILFNLVIIGKQFCSLQIFYSLNKGSLIMKTFNSIRNHLKNFGYRIKEWFCGAKQQ